MNSVAVQKDILAIEPQTTAEAIQRSISDFVFRKARRWGAVVGLSGGIDSSVTAALCVRALGRERVFGILMPEEDSSEDSARLGSLVADHLGISTVVEDIAAVLRTLGCYQRRDDAIRKVIPQYTTGWKSKIVLPDILSGAHYALFSVVASSPDGEIHRARLTREAYLGVVAATNFKQRTRKMIEYYHADRLWYAVAGTPNRLEYSLGFFVKNGDGAADFKPIAHLYKSQVYQLAAYLGIPEDIQRRPPTTDTYSLEQSQEEFYFSVPLAAMDLCLYARNHKIPAKEIAPACELSVEQVERVFASIDTKLAATRFLHLPPELVEPVEEVKRI